MALNIICEVEFHLVLSSGHCVHQGPKGGGLLADDGKFELMVSVRGKFEKRLFKIKSFLTTNEWAKEAKFTADIALVVLHEAPNVGFLPYASITLKPTEILATVGFPGDKGVDQYETACPIDRIEGNLIFHKCDTMVGQSGSPYFVWMQGKPILCGIHSSGSGGSNIGPQLTPAYLAMIQGWIRASP